MGSTEHRFRYIVIAHRDRHLRIQKSEFPRKPLDRIGFYREVSIFDACADPL